MARIFISHSSRDAKQAEDLKAWLNSIGFEQTFLDFDKHAGIPPGADWERTLYREIERSQAVILILTKNWFNSKWCFAEFTQTRALGKAIFALVESPTGKTTIVSSDIQHLNLIKDRQAGLDSLARELTQVALNAQGGFHWDTVRSPYPGLLSFEGADAAIFFGRDDDVLRAIERINARRVNAGAKLVVILGGSGSGKSSLLKAGILPRIARDRANFLVGPPFRPGSDPIGNLLSALHGIDLTLTRADLDAIVEAGTPTTADIGEDAERSARARRAEQAEKARALINRLRVVAKAPQATLIIAVDQAEESFTSRDSGARARFFDLLSAMLSGDNPALAVWTLRSDHLPDLQAAEHLRVKVEEFSLKPMPIERLGLIVKGPAEIGGLAIEESLVSALMRDAKTQDALPLVAFVLRRLYDSRRGDVLTQRHYEDMRDGKLSPLEVAVRDAANEAMARENPSSEILDALREAFVPALVRVNDEGGFVRQSARLTSLPASAHQMLQQLANVRLLAIDNGIVEVAHEALFRVWPLLAQWLEEEREFLVGKSRIEKSREDYAKLAPEDRAKGLLSGILLERAKNWLINHPGRFSSEEVAFISASVDEMERQELERAAQRERLRQIELAHAKGEAERAKQQAEATKRFLRFAVAAAVVLAVLSAVAVYFWVSADTAERMAKTNFSLAIDQAASNVDTVVDAYQKGRISTRLLRALISRAQETVDSLHSDTSEAAAAKARLLRAVSRAYIVLSQASLAEKKAREGLQITEQYLKLNPADSEWMQLDERAREELAQSLFWEGDLDGALANLWQAMATAKVLIARSPDNKDYNQDLIEIYRFIGDSLRNQARIDEAFIQYRAWLDRSNELAQKQPDETAWLRDQTFARQRAGDVFIAQGKAKEAGEQFKLYLDLALKGQQKEAGNDDKEFTEAVSIAHERIGDALFAQGDMDGAMKEYRTFLPLAEKLAKVDQSNFIWNQNLEVAHQRLGEVYLRREDFPQAMREFEIFFQMARDTLEKDRGNGTALFDVTNAMEKIGDALRGAKDYAGAMTQYQNMLTNMTLLRQRDISNAIWKKAFANSYQRIGLTLELSGNKAGALANYRSCAAVKVPSVLWNLRDVWPPDVTRWCEQKVSELGATPR